MLGLAWRSTQFSVDLRLILFPHGTALLRAARLRPAAVSSRLPQQLTETAMHGQGQYFLYRTSRFMSKVILAATGRASQQDPVGRAIAGPSEPLRIDEGFQ